jgi:3-hydroxyacyl-CoA dehydrogenase
LQSSAAGVIGRSYTALFLSHGLKVLVFVSEKSPASDKKLQDYLENVWPTIEKQGIKEGGLINNYQVLSRVDDLESRLKECEFIVEVYVVLATYRASFSVSLITMFHLCFQFLLFILRVYN